MRIPSLLLASATLALATTASAQDSGVYAGVSVDALEFDAYGVSVRGGYNFTEFFGAEVQAGFGIIDEEETVNGIEASAGLDEYLAAFAVGRLPVGESVDLIGRVGYYYAGLSGEAEGFEVSTDEDGIAFGAGAQFNFGAGAANGIRIEYTNLDGDGGSADLFSLGFMRRF